MKTNFLFSAVALILVAQTASSAVTCKYVHQKTPFVNYENSFYYTQKIEAEGYTVEQLKAFNERTLRDLENEIPTMNRSPIDQRAGSISVKDASAVVNAIHSNPVANPAKTYLYEKPGQGIGYCFGRASFAHLLLLKMGVRKEAIKKIWVVGPMKAFGNNWGFHVATLAHTKEKGWVAIDSNSGHIQTAAEWMKQYAAFSVDGKVRFYVSEASRFGVFPERYNRDNLGLDMPKEQDFYKNYFVELMQSLKGKTLEDLGLPRIAKEPAVEGAEFAVQVATDPARRTLRQIVRDFFRF